MELSIGDTYRRNGAYSVRESVKDPSTPARNGMFPKRNHTYAVGAAKDRINHECRCAACRARYGQRPQSALGASIGHSLSLTADAAPGKNKQECWAYTGHNYMPHQVRTSRSAGRAGAAIVSNGAVHAAESDGAEARRASGGGAVLVGVAPARKAR